jgi:hypothetical protein
MSGHISREIDVNMDDVMTIRAAADTTGIRLTLVAQ